ncbi:alpha-N-acetylglucosaminidase-like isoform X2 [Glandiceps talaboti]
MKASTSVIVAVLLSVSTLLPCSTTSLNDFKTLDHLKPSVSAETQAQTVRDMIQRLIPERASQFKVVVDPSIGPVNLDTFEIETTGDNETTVRGTTGVAAASAFQHYLNTYCHCHISWSGDQLNIPANLPVVVPKVSMTSPNRFRYYQNVCTVSYSLAWWDWTRWQREIDWMAMNGINLPLAFNAQEAIWQRVYEELGFSQEDLDPFFGGPAFLAWARMGNMRGWGGPLPQSWHGIQVQLQHKILERMRAFGIIPVLPAFAGFVPKAFARVFPNANLTRLSDWGRFNDTYCCSYLLSPQDPLFIPVGQLFVKEYIKEFGTDHIYNTDMFNEMSPPSRNQSYLSAASKVVHDTMLAADPQAIWLMQGWLFQNSFWGPNETQAYLQGVPLGKMIVLDLMAEVYPIYKKTKSFYGQPFIWCMLHNFGGNIEMYGAMDNINQGPSEAQAFTNSTMIGTGLTPEGINQNYVVYDFMNQMGWRNEPVANLQHWVKDYAHSRYGNMSQGAEKAWDILIKSVYNCTDRHKDHAKSIIIKRPSLKMQPDMWYKLQDVIDAWYSMVHGTKQERSLQNSETFRYDLIDVSRQALQDVAFCSIYKTIQDDYNNYDAAGIRQQGDQLLELFDDLDVLLSSNEYYLLGHWIHSAKSLGTNQKDRDLYEYNARNQITLWGPDGEILDYGNKMWGGLMKSYYKSRWQLFINMLVNSTSQHHKFDQKAFEKAVLPVEIAWTFEKNVYPITPQGDAITISQQLLAKYEPLFDKAVQNCDFQTPKKRTFTRNGVSSDDYLQL